MLFNPISFDWVIEEEEEEEEEEEDSMENQRDMFFKRDSMIVFIYLCIF